jgi:uncharacterized protein (TIGR03435 family)
MFRVAALTGLCFLQSLAIRAQEPAPLSFEVASLKATRPGAIGGGLGPRAGGETYIASNVSLRTLITTAYNVSNEQISGGPGWVDSDGFDLEAKTGRRVTREERLVMMQTLLAERFKLVLRRETRQVPVYIMTVEKTGVKLRENTTGEQSGLGAGGGQRKFVGRNVPMSLLVWYLQNTWKLDRPVVDQTGLKGSYDWELEFSPEADPLKPPSDVDLSGRPPLIEALRMQLGLRLEAQKGPAEFLTIEHVEKPSEN